MSFGASTCLCVSTGHVSDIKNRKEKTTNSWPCCGRKWQCCIPESQGTHSLSPTGNLDRSKSQANTSDREKHDCRHVFSQFNELKNQHNHHIIADHFRTPNYYWRKLMQISKFLYASDNAYTSTKVYRALKATLKEKEAWTLNIKKNLTWRNDSSVKYMPDI